MATPLGGALLRDNAHDRSRYSRPITGPVRSLQTIEETQRPFLSSPYEMAPVDFTQRRRPNLPACCCRGQQDATQDEAGRASQRVSEWAARCER